MKSCNVEPGTILLNHDITVLPTRNLVVKCDNTITIIS